ncbi:uncharacterized protein BDZ99DRAFT_7767 [Mytilinidion resinicola]|uniref:Uncharacterized protein n=1 Tax=Mytilinidion resinicola TaxID=574789 RepID=A0A6A6Z8J9_9PEZI|nr:uncharacterized protein BDZ99DRAFT_7767 [Mytilinidion resinicola]KAF2817039.1 hypothetical protein BDZ99DRAFT_7767 [Mytilinidion resinicola]
MAARPPQSPWLAISVAGCCASAELREEKEAALRANSPVEMQICYDQPRAVELPRAEPEHPRPMTSHSVSRHVSQWVMSGRDTMSRASIRTSSSTVKRPWVAHPKGRPSISGPTDFRRVEGLDTFQEEEAMPVRRRRSFRPLELSIYVDNGRLSPLPDFAEAEWSSLPAGLEFPAQARVRSSSKTDSISSNTSYRIQRKPVGSNRSSVSSSISRPASTHLPQTESFCQSPSTFQRSGTISSIASPRTPLSSLPSPSRARSCTDSPHTLPKRGSLRRAKTDVEREIRELNTIVEDRRADARLGPSAAFPNIPPPSPSHHVPAIAPSLRMHVRSETLSDIGSAFSVPFVSKPLPSSPLPNARSRSQPSSPTPSLFATRTQKLKLIPPPPPTPSRTAKLQPHHPAHPHRPNAHHAPRPSRCLAQTLYPFVPNYTHLCRCVQDLETDPAAALHPDAFLPVHAAAAATRNTPPAQRHRERHAVAALAPTHAPSERGNRDCHAAVVPVDAGAELAHGEPDVRGRGEERTVPLWAGEPGDAERAVAGRVGEGDGGGCEDGWD